MNPTWRKAIRYRNNLWNKYRKSSTPENWTAYKKQRNITTSMRRKSISNYFSYKTSSLSSKPKQFWNTFGPLFNTKRSQVNDIILLDNNNNIMADKSDIAHEMNDYFTNIADTIKQVDVSQYGTDLANHPSIQTINNMMCTNQSSDAFNFTSVSSGVVANIVLALSSSKATGHDNIPIRLIKDGIGAIAKPLSTLFNYCTDVDYFPAYWKYGQVTPIYKKGSEVIYMNVF